MLSNRPRLRVLGPVLLAGAAGISITSWNAGFPGDGRANRPAPTRHKSSQLEVRGSYGKLPLSFEPNRGQSHRSVEFLARGPGYHLFLTPSEAVLSLDRASTARSPGARGKPRPPALLRTRLIGARANPKVAGLSPLPGKSHYYIGSDPRKWLIDVPNFARVKYEGVYPGIGLVYYGNGQRLEYDFELAPGADPKQIRMGIAGANKIAIDAQGSLNLATQAGAVRWRKPVVYQEIGGKRRCVAGKYVMLARNEVGFAIGAYDRQRRLVIDPVLDYSTYLGGSDVDGAYEIALDSNRNAYITGFAASTNFPVANAAQPTFRGGTHDAFVTKLNASGSALLYSTYLGGNNVENFNSFADIAVDLSGNAVVTGYTASTDFPTLNAFQATKSTGNDVFVTKLSAAGLLVYSTFLGGTGNENGAGIALDLSGRIYVTGTTGSSNFPTSTGAFQTTGGGSKAFVAKLNPSQIGAASRVYSTYLGGSAGDEGGIDLAVDMAGNAYVTGSTRAVNFPAVNAYQGALAGTPDPVSGIYPRDAFLSVLDSAGANLLYSTFLGGDAEDFGQGVALDAAGNVYVVGSAASANFPTINPIQATFAGGPLDAFLVKLSTAQVGAASGIYATYLGGSGNDGSFDVAVDGVGNAYLTGFTTSTNFPTVSPIQAALGGSPNNDAFIAKVNASGTGLLYSTYLGGSLSDVGNGIAVDALGSAYVAGLTSSANFPVQNAFQPAAALNAGGFPSGDAFIARIAETQAAPPSLLVADLDAFGGNGGVFRIDPSTGQTTAISSGGLFRAPAGVVTDASGNIYVVDLNAFGGRGGIIKLTFTPGTGWVQSAVASCLSFSDPRALAFEASGQLIVADLEGINDRRGSIIRVDPADGHDTVLSEDGAFTQPNGVAIDSAGNIIVTNNWATAGGPRSVIRVHPTTGAQTVIASGGTLEDPTGVAIDAGGDLFVTDANYFGDPGPGAVLRMNPTSGAFTVLSPRSLLVQPIGIARAADRQLYVADNGRPSAAPRIIHVDPVNGAQRLVKLGAPLVRPAGITVTSTLPQ